MGCSLFAVGAGPAGAGFVCAVLADVGGQGIGEGKAEAFSDPCRAAEGDALAAFGARDRVEANTTLGAQVAEVEAGCGADEFEAMAEQHLVGVTVSHGRLPAVRVCRRGP